MAGVFRDSRLYTTRTGYDSLLYMAPLSTGLRSLPPAGFSPSGAALVPSACLMSTPVFNLSAALMAWFSRMLFTGCMLSANYLSRTSCLLDALLRICESAPALEFWKGEK